MPYRITARINVETGEFELFQVDDLDPATNVQEHNARHEEAAERIGRFVDRHPLIEEVPVGGGDPGAATIPRLQAEDEQETQHGEQQRRHGLS